MEIVYRSCIQEESVDLPNKPKRKEYWNSNHHRLHLYESEKSRDILKRWALGNLIHLLFHNCLELTSALKGKQSSEQNSPPNLMNIANLDLALSQIDYQIDSLQKSHCGTILTSISSQITIDQKCDLLFSLSKSESKWWCWDGGSPTKSASNIEHQLNLSRALSAFDLTQEKLMSSLNRTRL